MHMEHLLSPETLGVTPPESDIVLVPPEGEEGGSEFGKRLCWLCDFPSGEGVSFLQFGSAWFLFCFFGSAWFGHFLRCGNSLAVGCVAPSCSPHHGAHWGLHQCLGLLCTTLPYSAPPGPPCVFTYVSLSSACVVAAFSI